MIKSRAAAAVMAHQKLSIAHDAKNPIVFDMSDAGCVSADTEFLTPAGWKRIDQYLPGDQVAQFHPKTRQIDFVVPKEYVKRPCNRMIAIAPTRGTSQRLSHEHRVLYYRPDGTHGVCSASEFSSELKAIGPNHQRKKFATTFSVKSKSSLGVSDEQLRLMVAVIADGHFPTEHSGKCTVRLKKLRKIERLRMLLSAAGLPFVERTCGGDPSFQVFRFEPIGNDKEFGATWWQASQAQLEIIADELPHWDSAIDSRPSAGVRFSSFSKASADFAQYAFSAAKRPASLLVHARNRENRGHMTEFVVQARANDCFVGPGRKESVFEVSNPEGFKYCFEVPTSFLLLRHNGYIFATGNTGKTLVRVVTFAARRRKGSGCMLVLAPRSLLRLAWAADFNKFAPDMKVSVATADRRADALSEDADVYIVNHDGVKDLLKMPKAWWSKFNELAIDEPTAYKHHTSQRSKAAAKVAKHFKQRKLMTATPMSNGVCDIWHQVLLLDDGKRLGTSFFAFRNTVCEPKQVGRHKHAIQWTDKDGAEEAVFGLLGDIVIRHKREDCIDIPPTQFYAMDYAMPAKQRKAYDEMAEHQILLLSQNKSVTAINKAAVRTKLLQIASGAVYDGAGNYVVIDRGRYEAVIEMASVRRHPLILFLWRHQKELMIEEATARGKTFCVFDGDANDAERNRMVMGYQAGEYDFMFGHPQTVAHGLTLTNGTSIIWPSPTDNLEWWLQANQRQARIGQKRKTEVISLIAPGTFDERAYDLCQGKETRQGILLDLFDSISPKTTAVKVARKLVRA